MKNKLNEANAEWAVVELRGMTIEIRSSEVVYIGIGDKTFYVDDSTGEAIMEWWPRQSSTWEEGS